MIRRCHVQNLPRCLRSLNWREDDDVSLRTAHRCGNQILATEPMRMIDPPSFVRGKAFCTVNSVPFRFRQVLSSIPKTLDGVRFRSAKARRSKLCAKRRFAHVLGHRMFQHGGAMDHNARHTCPGDRTVSRLPSARASAAVTFSILGMSDPVCSFLN